MKVYAERLLTDADLYAINHARLMKNIEYENSITDEIKNYLITGVINFLKDKIKVDIKIKPSGVHRLELTVLSNKDLDQINLHLKQYAETLDYAQEQTFIRHWENIRLILLGDKML